MNTKHKPLTPNEAYKKDAEFAQEQHSDKKQPKSDPKQTDGDKSTT
ncbi:MAG: hypothetical protein KGO83_00915 [Paenibacillaceae bacterium]|jgi:hypothetical protein|nr:hypothetical protein [Paenibacillaceae bacterium]